LERLGDKTFGYRTRPDADKNDDGISPASIIVIIIIRDTVKI
jgi:hypothetical protein